jgi:hypothetical protein
MKNLTKIALVLLLNVLLVANVSFAQGNLEGYVKKDNGEIALFVNVQVYNDLLERTTVTNEDGFFSFSNLPEGIYNIKMFAFGNETTAKDIPVSNNKTNSIRLSMINPEIVGPEGTVVWIKGLFDNENPTLVTKTAIDLKNEPIRTPQKLETTIAGASTDASGNVSYRGARPGSSVYYIDGMRSEGALNIPMSSIYTFDVVTGGISARYGETLSAVVSIETKSYFNMGGK